MRQAKITERDLEDARAFLAWLESVHAGEMPGTDGAVFNPFLDAHCGKAIAALIKLPHKLGSLSKVIHAVEAET
jgi:hypothetical protein